MNSNGRMAASPNAKTAVAEARPEIASNCVVITDSVRALARVIQVEIFL
ncbi:MAG TPA: hypothetical protein VKB38_20020 [Terracidiphilus sp.]|nr:hypothetical protein [Terracidiphilus sp.]